MLLIYLLQIRQQQSLQFIYMKQEKIVILIVLIVIGYAHGHSHGHHQHSHRNHQHHHQHSHSHQHQHHQNRHDHHHQHQHQHQHQHLHHNHHKHQRHHNHQHHQQQHHKHSHSHQHRHQQHVQDPKSFQQTQINNKQNTNIKIQTQTEQKDDAKLLQFFTSAFNQLQQWLPLSNLTDTLHTCHILQQPQLYLSFYQVLLQHSYSLLNTHLPIIQQQFKTNPQLAKGLQCLVSARTIENKYFESNKKIKQLTSFLKAHSAQGKDIFPAHNNYTLIGHKIGYFFKAFFEYYYLEVVNPAGTLSSEFIRALTIRSNIFEHQDIAYCIHLDSVGILSTELQNMDINNIFLKIPNIYSALKHLKLKEKCKDEHSLRLVSNLRKALDGLDMFKIMYGDYTPFVEIAAEKFTNSQIRMLARKFAHIIANKQEYLKLSKSAQEQL